MRISKVDIYYGGFHATSYQVKKRKGGVLEFAWGDYSVIEHVTQSPRSHEEWVNFIMELASITQNWESDYDLYACDGIQWSVVFRVDKTWRYCQGSNKYPENFGLFVKLVRSFCEEPTFAEGFD